MLPTEPSRGSLRIVSGLAENTNSIFGEGSSEPETANGCLRREKDGLGASGFQPVSFVQDAPVTHGRSTICTYRDVQI